MTDSLAPIIVALIFATTALRLAHIVKEAWRATRPDYQPLADAIRYTAECRMGLHRPEDPPDAKPTTAEVKFAEWHGSHPFSSEEESGHLWGLWEMMTGKRNANATKRAEALLTLTRYGAPIPDGLGI